jgi:hypothetical protein
MVPTQNYLLKTSSLRTTNYKFTKLHAIYMYSRACIFINICNLIIDDLVLQCQYCYILH